MDQASIARRLCRRWGVPPWLAAIIGHLDLAPGHATSLGASADLLRVVQLAVAVAQENGVRLSLATGDAAAGNAHALGLAGGDLDVVAAAARAAMAEDLPRRDPPPQPPLLRDLLRTAAELRRARENTVVGQLEREVDDLHAALRDQRATEDARLRTMKLSALAEFAAGASHEINNPLAVISGQAQYLLNQEPDPSRQRALHTIVGQARRVHQVLTELMQFARPPRPEIESVEASGLLADVTRSVSELAEQRRVRVECVPPNRPVFLRADPRQLHTALACILRNAVEAAPPDGWARLRLVEKGDAWEFAVEDNGGEPSPAQSEHLFDPFFSGRLAGRGRGLGLSTAWQLARGHGGDVRYDGHQAGVTRFVLTLPRTADVVPQSPDPAALAGPDGHHTSPVNGQLRVSCGP